LVECCECSRDADKKGAAWTASVNSSQQRKASEEAETESDGDHGGGRREIKL
jgi:hypothetical protein